MKEVAGNIGFLVKVMKPYWRSCFFLTVLGTAGVFFSLGIVEQSKRAFDISSGAVKGSLGGCLAVLACLFVFSILLNSWAAWLNVKYQLRVRNELTAKVFSHILRAEWLPAQRYHSGDVMSRVNTDINDWVQLVSATIPQFFVTLFKLCGAFVFLFLMDRMLALLLAMLVPLVLLLSKLYFRKLRKLSLEIKDAFTSVRQYFQESIQHQCAVKALHLQSCFEECLDCRQAKYAERICSHTRLSVSSHFILALGFTVGYCLSLAWGLFRLEAGEITFGTMTAFLQLVHMIQGPAAGLMGVVPAFIVAYTATERLRDLWMLPAEKEEKDVCLDKVERIKLENVAFGYLPGKKILDGVTLDFQPGLTALVGSTGCGKTTVIRLILGLISPEKGRVLLSGAGRDYEMQPSLRCNLAYVPQDTFLFSGTVRENLQMGNPQATDEDMIRALKSVAADFVWKNREGLDTELKENGQGLSGGQVQRLALARALLSRADALLLDEATSALDMDTESDIMNTLKRSVQGKIVIVVSHRQTVVDCCDKVYKMHETA